jgi:hypothetical protein
MSGGVLLVAGIRVAIAIARCGSNQPAHLTPQVYEPAELVSAADASLAAPEPAPTPPSVEDAHVGDAEARCLVIEDHAHPASNAQRAAAAGLRCAISGSCTSRRAALRALVDAPPVSDPDARGIAAAAIHAIQQDVGALCPEEHR